MGAYLSKEANFAVVGCGEAGKAAGWFHGYQLVAGGVEGARLSDVVEPFLLSEEGRATPAGAAFQELVGRWAGTAVDFHREIVEDELFANAYEALGGELGVFPSPKVALVAASPVEAPSLAEASLRAGATHLLLEPPGAATAAGLRELAAVCEAKDAPLYVAFDLLRAEHVAGARAVDGDVVLVGRGGDGDDDAALAAAFAARPEGLLVSGMTQELDACARGWGLRRAAVKAVEVHAAGCDLRTLDGLTDFVAVDFTLVGADGGRVRVAFDRRAAGPPPRAAVSDRATGAELYAAAPRAAAGDEWAPPGLRARAAAALRVKADLAAAALRRGEPAGDVARAAAAADALDLAEYLLPVLRAAAGA